MSFNRYRVQSAIELEVGCTDLTKWNSYGQKFKEYELTEQMSEKLLVELKKDAADIYFKAIFSLADSINGISHGRHSWSVIKIYYATFFFLRCYFATKKHAFLKNKGIFTLKLAKGEVPVRRDLGKHLSEKVSGDHKTTIVTFINLFKDEDVLLSNTIEGKSIYEWLMDIRNQVNYRERAFTEPDGQYFYRDLFDNNKLKAQVETYLKDEDYVYCFDEDHCSLAAPLKLALIVKEKLYNFIDFEPLTSEQRIEIDRLLKSSGLDDSQIFRSLYNFGRS
jgi:hypothetical protein